MLLANIGYTVGGAIFACAQTSALVPVTFDSVKTLAWKLRQNLQDGTILRADLHAMQLRLALAGGLREDMSGTVSAVEQQPDSNDAEPQLTAGLVPVADKLIEALDEPDLGLARKYSEQLAVQVHAQHELFRRQQADSNKSTNADYDRYFSLSEQLQQTLREGDIAAAAVLAVDVQSAEDSLVAKKKRLLNRPATIRMDIELLPCLMSQRTVAMGTA